MVARLAAVLFFVLFGAPCPVRAAERFIPLSQTGDALPALSLVAQNARHFTLADLRGNAIALSFIYTRCPDPKMCPLISAKFARAQEIIGTAPIRLVLLTLDPGHDTPRVLARYGRAFGQNTRYWTLATGAPAALDELAGRLGIATSTTRAGDFVHSEAAVIIGPDGRLARIIDGNDWTATELIDASRATLPGSNDPLIDARAWLSSTLERCGGGSLALGGTEMLGLFGLATVAMGTAFWLAFRRRIV